MGMLKILKVVYNGERYFYESPTFFNGLSIIEGPNGVGKTTFFNLIYFGLGGKVAEFEEEGNELHAEIHDDRNNYVQLFVSISGVEYSLIRKFRENSITVLHQNELDPDAEGSLVLPVFRKEQSIEIFSDWILEKLGIPVVDIFQSGRTFKLNFSDLARLIFHNQAPDPHGIFKPADNSNFISDSLEIRRAIFQILVGKTLLALYESIGKFKRAERDYDSSRSLVREYQTIVDEILKSNGINEVRNITYLSEKISEVEKQLEKLYQTREVHNISPISPGDELNRLDDDKRQLGEIEIRTRTVTENIDRLTRDKCRIHDVEQSVREDIARISKVIHTHQQLKLFTSDTCPYCLNLVNRPEDHCVCGNKVDENDYQRFFYDPGEYVDILKSKIKSFDTLQIAADDIDQELQEYRVSLAQLSKDSEKYRDKIDKVYATSGMSSRDVFRENLDEKIFEQKNIINELEQALKLESKLSGYQKKATAAKMAYGLAQQKMRLLDAASKVELQGKLEDFNERYNYFLTTVLSDCRVATIDLETYLPIINNGVYREASADVHKRFLYYLTLLQMSLADEIPFPKLLLIDTPETSGIDKDNLVRMMRQIHQLDALSGNYQILMATGIGKYPPEFEEKVVIRLSVENRLLIKRNVQPA